MTFGAFFDQLGNLDWLAILVGMIVAGVLGYVWYGPAFGKLWAAKSGVGMQSGEPTKMALTFAYFLVFNVGLQYLGLVYDGANIEHSLVAGLVLAVLAIAPALYSAVVWASKNMTVFLIDVGFWFVATALCVFAQSLVV
jgi:hypothetical protein